LLESGKSLGEGPGLHWYQNRHKVSHKLSPMFSSGVWADTMEVAAPWSRLDQLHTEVRAALGKHALVMAHFSHAYPEGCSIYFSFTGPGNLESYDSAWKAGLDAALNVGGTVTHHHGVGRLKSSAATREAGASIRVWRATKQRLDPNDMMNPGRPLENTQFAATEIAKPTGDIVLSVDALSLMAEVRPEHPIEEIESALNSQGFCLKQHPDAPFTDDTLLSWLQNLQPGQIRPPDCPLFGIQARFEDNVATRIGCAPRSAAGPDLRWSLLQDETVEMVQISIRRLGSQ